MVAIKCNMQKKLNSKYEIEVQNVVTGMKDKILKKRKKESLLHKLVALGLVTS